MDLAAGCYGLAKTLPRAEEYRLTSQLLRAAAAVPANLAEGSGRGTRREYTHFVSIAYGSLCETETHLMLLVRADLASSHDVERLLSLCREVGRMLVSLRSKLRAQPAGLNETIDDASTLET